MTNRLTLLVCTALLAPSLAAAQPKSPEEYYKEGENFYNLGDFKQAVDAFKKGFELEPNESKKSAYLYNIAQSYRQAKDCTNAQFFYKRYLALKDNDTRKPLTPEKRKEIEDRIADLDACAKQEETLRKQKESTQPLEGDPTGGGGVGDKTPPDGGSVVEQPPMPQPVLLSARLLAGLAKIGSGDVSVPVQATGALIGGYPIPINPKLFVEVGAGFTWTPVPWDAPMAATNTGQLIALMANGGATYEVARNLGLRGDLGLGVLWFSGISESPFTRDPMTGVPRETDGPLPMFHLRIGVSADYAITPNIVATATPLTFSYSPAKSGLEKSIGAITALDFMIGLGYRM